MNIDALMVIELLLWVCMIIAAGREFLVLLKSGPSLNAITDDIRNSKHFWYTWVACFFALCLVARFIPSAPRLNMSPANEYEDTEKQVTHNGSHNNGNDYPFSCTKVLKEGNSWRILGTITISGAQFKNTIISPHSIVVNGTDVYQFIERECTNNN